MQNVGHDLPPQCCAVTDAVSLRIIAWMASRDHRLLRVLA